MTVASITTDINIGPYKIPSNAQNMIMNNYANRFNLSIEVVIPEPIMSNELATTQWLNKEFKFSNIILCSIYQLPEDKIKINKLLKNMQGVKFHFAIEGMSGKGSKFIRKCISEVKIFNSTKIINSENEDWLKLYKKFKNKYNK